MNGSNIASPLKGPLPNLTPEQQREVLAANHMMAQEIQALRSNLESLQVILAASIFREKGLIKDNLLVAPGHPGIVATGPLEYVVSQDQINALESLFPGDHPTVIYKQEVVMDKTYLRILLTSLSDAEQTSARALN